MMPLKGVQSCQRHAIHRKRLRAYDNESTYHAIIRVSVLQLSEIILKQTHKTPVVVRVGFKLSRSNCALLTVLPRSRCEKVCALETQSDAYAWRNHADVENKLVTLENSSASEYDRARDERVSNERLFPSPTSLRSTQTC
jgi:hypothetical protein